jgi:hypothetical protein
MPGLAVKISEATDAMRADCESRSDDGQTGLPQPKIPSQHLSRNRPGIRRLIRCIWAFSCGARMFWITDRVGEPTLSRGRIRDCVISTTNAERSS